VNDEQRKTIMSNRTPAPSGIPAFIAGWDWFWFTPRNPTTLGLIRIFTGLVILYVHASYSFGLMEYVHPTKGWLGREATEYSRYKIDTFNVRNDWNPPWQDPDYRLSSGQYTWSVFFHLEDDAAIWAVHLFILLVMFLFTLGLWTRVTGVLSWIGALQFVERAQVILFGMDTMIILGLFYLMIGPAGAALSLDHWLAQRRERLRRGDPTYRLPAQPSVLANLSIRMIQVQFCLMYFAAGTSKLLGPNWWNGTAIWGTVANYEFAPFYLSWWEPALRELASNRPLWELNMAMGAVFTLVLELGFPFLVWYPPLRWLMVTGAVLLHTGIGLIMGLTTFSLMMLALVASFIPSETIEAVLARLTSTAPATKPVTTATTTPAPSPA
jgi:hypothetical protein